MCYVYSMVMPKGIKYASTGVKDADEMHLRSLSIIIVPSLPVS
jgi:hypothetical protein